MRRVRFYLGTGYRGVDYEERMEFPDGTEDEEIEEAYKDWENNILEKQWWDEK